MSAVAPPVPDAESPDGTPTPAEVPARHEGESPPIVGDVHSSSTAPDPFETRVQSLERQVAFERLLSELSLAFARATPSHVDGLLAHWLERLTEFLAVDRITLYEYSEADDALHCAYHFRKPGAEPPPSTLEGASLPSVIAALKRGDQVRYARASDVPASDRMGVEPFRFPSVLGIPFSIPGALGYVAFSTLREERVWDEEVVERLQPIVELFATAVVRKRAEQRRDVVEPVARATEFAELVMSVVGHDLRNPLSAVSGLTQLLLAKDGLPVDVVRRIAAIDAAAKRMNDLIESVLDFGETQLTGGLAIARTPTDLSALCKRGIEAQLAARPGARLLFDGPAELRGFWDPVRMGQMIAGLLSNALTRSAPDEPVGVRLDIDSGAAVFAVRDRGVVIPVAMLRQVFEPLAPDQAHQSPWAQGVALRLHIVQQIARSHGGTLHVESSHEIGTIFTVRLPLLAVS